jgi:sulfatase modifying factor 1
MRLGERLRRAGDPRLRHGPLNEIAWHRGNSGSHPHPVATLAPNALGSCDLPGNVWEWTSTWYLAEEYQRLADGADASRGPRRGSVLALRGGSWYDPPSRLRASARYGAAWSFSAGHAGFRLARRP